MEHLGFDSRLTKTAPFQRAIGIGMCTWKFCHGKEEQQGKGGARGPTVKLEKRCVVWRCKRWSSHVCGVKTMGLDHMVWFVFSLSGMATSTHLSEPDFGFLFKSRLARTKGKFVCLWTSLMCNIWDSIINVSFGCQNPLEALMKLYGYPPIHASSDDSAVDLIFIHYICLLLVSFRSVFICSVLYFVALYKSHVPHYLGYVCLFLCVKNIFVLNWFILIFLDHFNV